LDGPLYKICLTCPTVIQDGRQSGTYFNIGPYGKHILINSSETTEANWTKLYRNDVWKVLYKDCSFYSDLPKNMAASTEYSL